MSKEDPKNGAGAMVAKLAGVVAKNLPDIGPHPILELAEGASVFLIDGNVYSSSNGDATEDFVERKGKKTNEKTYLAQLGSFDFFDELYLSRSEQVMDVASLVCEKELESSIELPAKNEDLDLPQIIYREVFPYLANGKFEKEVSSLLGISYEGRESGASQLGKNKNDSVVLAKIKEINQQIGLYLRNVPDLDEPAPPKGNRNVKEKKLDLLLSEPIIIKARPVDKDAGLFFKALKGYDLALIDGKIFEMAKAKKNSDLEISVSVANTRYELVPSRKTLAELDRLYKFNLGKKMVSDVLKQYISENKALALFEKQNGVLLSMRDREEYAGDGFGFLKHDNDYYAYLEVPDFAIKSQFDGEHYLFKKSRIGIYVYMDGGRLRYNSSFYMIDNNNHPFVHNQKGPFVSICTASQSFPSSGKTEGEVIAKRLRRCRELLMFAYTGDRYNSCYQLRRKCSENHASHFEANYVEKSDLEKGITIIKGGSR